MPFSDISYRELVTSSLFFERILADASDAIIAMDPAQEILLFNKAAEVVFGYSPSEVLGRKLDLLLPEQARPLHGHHVEGFLDEDVERRAMHERSELVGRRKDGSLFPIEVTISKLDVAGRTVLTGIVRDVSERRRLETQALAESERFRKLFEHATDAILVVDETNFIRFATPSLERLLGFALKDRLGRNGFELIHPDDLDGYRRFFDHVAASSGRTARYEVRVCHADGQYRWLDMSVANLFDEPSIAGLVVNARDITAEKEAALTLAHHALHDELTGLPNRALLVERLRHTLEAVSREDDGVGVFFVDLDRFKVINESVGHRAADRLLVKVAARFRASMRPADTVARFGGDAFVVISPGIHTVTQASAVATRLAACLDEPVDLDGKAHFMTASIGIVLAQSGDDPERVVSDANIATFRAKDSGRGLYEVFDESLRTGMQELRTLEEDLRLAVQRREFVTYFQPVVELRTGEVKGVEALVRWQHPTRGLLMPDSFIPVAESSGLIVGMGKIVLEDACRAVVEHERRSGETLELAVNVSPHELTAPGFAETFAGILAATGLDPTRLVAEITESAVIDDMAATVVLLEKLKSIGVRIAMDDFGTGSSSLSYLSRLPVDIVKIDRSFVSAMEESRLNAVIVAAICSMGAAMELHVIAEGVETQSEWDRLRELGCPAGQGYLFGRPRPEL